MTGTDTRPGYRDIAARLRDAITSGELAEGDVLPSEQRLAAEYGVARMTAREALKMLEAEGLVRVSGRQRRVRRHAPLELSWAAAESAGWTADMTRLGHQHRTRVTVQIEGGRLTRRVLREVDGSPHSLAVLTFPLDIAQGTRLAVDEDIPEGAFTYLKEDLGWAGMSESASIGARMPLPDEARVLDIPAGVPVLTEHRTGTREGRVVYESVRILPADRTQFRLRT